MNKRSTANASWWLDCADRATFVRELAERHPAMCATHDHAVRRITQDDVDARRERLEAERAKAGNGFHARRKRLSAERSAQGLHGGRPG